MRRSVVIVEKSRAISDLARTAHASVSCRRSIWRSQTGVRKLAFGRQEHSISCRSMPHSQRRDPDCPIGDLAASDRISAATAIGAVTSVAASACCASPAPTRASGFRSDHAFVPPNRALVMMRAGSCFEIRQQPVAPRASLGLSGTSAITWVSLHAPITGHPAFPEVCWGPLPGGQAESLRPVCLVISDGDPDPCAKGLERRLIPLAQSYEASTGRVCGPGAAQPRQRSRRG
jgi:hypothetical protein